MSVNKSRAKLKKANNGREYHIIWLNELYPPYWGEGTNMYPRYNRGFKSPSKRLQRYQQQAYRTWKYNRLTRWK